MRNARLGGGAAALMLSLGLAVATGVSYAEPLGHTTEDQTLQAGPPISPGSKFERGHRDRLLQGRAEHFDSADRPES